MGKPGGFFKKLKAKQKRAAAGRQRGTKGASTEERRRKHNERVEYYAAKREAEDLAAVSSSSESEASTDSEKEMAMRDRKLTKLRNLLGIEKAAAPKGLKQPAKRGRDDSALSDSAGEEEDEGDLADEGELPSENSIVDSEDDSEYEREVAKRKEALKNKKAKLAARRHRTEGGEEDAEGEDFADADDWEAYLRGADTSDSEEEDDSDDSDDASDRLKDDDLLIDNISEDEALGEEDADEEDAANPFFDLLEEGSDAEGDEDDLIDPEEFEEEEVEESEDGNGQEDEFVDDESAVDFDEESDGDRSDVGGKGKTANGDGADDESHSLLPQFKLGSTSLATLQSSGVVTSADDPWYLKYHVDAAKEIDRTPLEHVAISTQALEVLREANTARQQRAKRREVEEGAAVTKKDVMFVTADDYNGVHPDNVSVAATTSARLYFKQFPPFGAAASPTFSPSSSPSAAKRPPYIHEVLWRKWVEYRTGVASELPYFSNTAEVVLTSEERGFFDILQGYADVMDCTRCWQIGESRREIFVLHLLNHWFKARAVVLAHDKMLAAHKERRHRRRQRQQERAGVNGHAKKGTRKVVFADEQDECQGDDEEDLELRDRGFGKTRLFVMLPMRNQAYEYVNTIVRILGADPQDCPKLAMFEQDFTEVAEAMDPTFKRRPKEYQRQFAGNIDDSFCVGLRLEPNRVHVYAHPLNSDIIICSPLGLRRRLERNGDILVSLSSIEVCVVDEAHVLLEQNWQQVTAVMELLNKRPTETTHGLSDLRRVYAWALEGKSGRHRQTVISSDLSNATILSTFRGAVNSFGKVVLQHRTEEGVLGTVQVPIRQHFLRFEPQSLGSLDDDRFTFFTSSVYPTKVNPLVERDVRTIVVVPSYFDFVRLRNFMYREYRESFTAISEYTSIKQQRRALGQFSDLERPMLLVTERFYYFKRYFVKFAEVLVFYSPPLFPTFYASLVNRLVATSPNALVMTVFSQYDTHELNRLVGTSRMRRMLERESGIFSFVTS